VNQSLDNSAIADHVAPDERLLWSGRPDMAALGDLRARRRGLSRFVTIPAFILLAVWILQAQSGIDIFSALVGLLHEEPAILIAIAIPLALPFAIRGLKLDRGSRLQRYFSGLHYGITDSRLLILDGTDLTSYTPERMQRPRLRERTPGCADVIFDERPLPLGGDQGRARDPILLERSQVGFKGQRDAEALLNTVERWLDWQMAKATDQFAEFGTRRADAGPDASTTEVLKIENADTGLEMQIPSAWSVRVRQKAEPQGHAFLDREEWYSLDAGSRWNLVRVEGPEHCMVEVEVFETEPTLTFRKLARSRIADTLSGKVIDSNPDYTQNGLRGFHVTRRTDLIMNPETGRVGIAAVVAPQRRTVLYGDGRQICILSSWPENAAGLQHAVEAVVESVRLTGKSASSTHITVPAADC